MSINSRKIIVSSVLFLLLLTGASGLSLRCSTTDAAGDDPLRNTKRLVKKGHSSLYNNGAFPVKGTSIRVIPPGPTLSELGQEIIGMGGRESFLESLLRAREAVVVVTRGMDYTFAVKNKIDKKTVRILQAIQEFSHEKSRLVIYKSYAEANDIKGRSWKFSQETAKRMREAGRKLSQTSDESGSGQSARGAGWITATPELVSQIVSRAFSDASRTRTELNEESSRLAKGITREGDQIILEGDQFLRGALNSGKKSYDDWTENIEERSQAIKERAEQIDAGSQKLGEELSARGKERLQSAVRRIPESNQKAKEVASELGESVSQSGDSIVEESKAVGDEIIRESRKAARDVKSKTFQEAGRLSRLGNRKAADQFKYGVNRFVVGYLELPEKLEERMSVVNLRERFERFQERVAITEEWRKPKSQSMSNIFIETIGNYTENVTSSLSRAVRTFKETSREAGVSLGVLKALRWVIDGLFWEGILKPAGKLTAALLGYITVNGIAYPTIVGVTGVASTLELAIEVSASAVGAGYDLVAPSGAAALAGALGLTNAIVHNAAAGTVASSGALLAGSELALGSMSGVTFKGVGGATGKAIKYIGVPITHLGVRVTGGVVGVAAATADTVSGAALYSTGKTVEGGGKATAAALEHVGEPVVRVATHVAGATAGAGRTVVDVVSGTVLYATGGVVKGTALAQEGLVKYGIAPTVSAAQITGGVAHATALGTGRVVAGSALYLWGQTVRYVGMGSGKVVEKGMVPVTMSGIVAAGVLTSGALKGGGKVSEQATLLGGRVAYGSAWVLGNTLQVGSVAGGAVASVSAGAGVGIFEVVKATSVKIGQLGGNGIVLSYGTLSQIGAHALLGVSDAAYLVLSLEGPRWVVYAVKGKIGEGEEVPTGAVLDLKEMEKQGEEFYNVPLSDDEMRRVVESTYETLPVSKEKSEEEE